MKKILLLLCTISVHSHAQQADITTPYIWREEEVVDTTKAIAAAKQIKAETEKEIMAQLKLVTSMREKKRKIKSEEEKALLKDLLQQCNDIPLAKKAIIDSYFAATRRWWLNKELPGEIATDLEKGKIHTYFYNAFEYIQEHLSNELIKITDSNDMDFANYVSPLPTKLMNVRHDNPDYADPNFHWLDRFDTKTLEHKSVSFPVKEDYWASSKYPAYKFHKRENEDFAFATWILYDQSNKLVAISKPDMSRRQDDENTELQFACAKYDYERNAYDINSQPEAVRKYVAQAFSTGKSLKAKRDDIVTTLYVKQMELEVAARNTRISESQYNKIMSDFKALAAKSEKEIAEIDKFPKDVMEKAENYIDQLKKDNVYPWKNLQAIRIDGLNYIFTLPDDNKLKAQATFRYNAKDEKVECSYVILEK